MTLPCSFPISASQINVELGRAANAAFDMQGASERALAGVPSGAISMSDFLCKSVFNDLGQQACGTRSSGNTTDTVNIGTATPTRVVFAVVQWENSTQDISLHTTGSLIGGITPFSQIVQSDFGGSTGMGAAILIATVPTGTTADVLLDWNNPGATKYTIRIFTSNTGFSQFDTIEKLGHFDTDISGSIDIPANGVLIVAGTGSTNTGGNSIAWTGVTETYDQDWPCGGSPAGGREGGGFNTKMDAETGRTIRMNMGTISNSGTVFVAVSGTV